MGNGHSASTDPTFIVAGAGSTLPVPPPATIYYTPQQRIQKVQDAYDGALQQSRFQFQSPIHF